MEKTECKNIVIVGLGVIGGSFAKGLCGLKQYRVMGVDANPTTIDQAKQEGLIVDDGLSCLSQADAVILALYPHIAIDFLQKNGQHIPAGAVVVDTSGIKRVVHDAFSPQSFDWDLVLAHPMAGKEKKGLQYASAEVFHNANFLIMPTQYNKEESLAFTERLARDLGFTNIQYISMGFHDRVISFTSQLPHVIAVSLMNAGLPPEEVVHYIGDSYRDFTRIAAINEQLWSELFLGNRDNLLHSMREFEKQWKKMKRALRRKDNLQLQECMRNAAERRNALTLASMNKPDSEKKK